jgi:xylulose-5-phosphate/fructose-6-phosphate phosphoketolase
MHHLEQTKPRLLGHWETTSGPNFIHVRLNRGINECTLRMTDATGPGLWDDIPGVRHR